MQEKLHHMIRSKTNLRLLFHQEGSSVRRAGASLNQQHFDAGVRIDVCLVLLHQMVVHVVMPMT